MRATVLTVQGRYAEARADCTRLVGLVAGVLRLRVRRGDRQPRPARRRPPYGDAATRAGARCRASTPTRRAWGEIAAGRDRAPPRRPGRRSGISARRSPPIRATSTCSARTATGCSIAAARADVIAAGRGRDRASTRCCCGSRSRSTRCGSPEAAASASRRLRARFDASRARGDTVHRREDARFALALRRRSRRARWRSPATTGRCSASRPTCAFSPRPRAPRATRTRWRPSRAMARRDGTRVSGASRRCRRGQEPANEALARCSSRPACGVHRARRRARAQAVATATSRSRSTARRSHGQWDIALRDLDFALGLDAEPGRRDHVGRGQGAGTRDIAAYALSRLQLGPGARAVPDAASREQLIDDHSDGAYAVLRFTATCAAAPTTLAVDYRLLLRPRSAASRARAASRRRARRAPGSSSVGRAATQTFTLAELSQLRAVRRLRASEGVLAHLDRLRPHPVPAVAAAAGRARASRSRRAGAGRRRRVSAHAFVDVLKVVTAFTLAHSITLSLAALGVVSAAVALGRVGDRAVGGARGAQQRVAGRATAALGRSRSRFGLIHGFGFASVLADLGLAAGLAAARAGGVQRRRRGGPARDRRGVPAGRLSRCARPALYRRGVLVGGSLLVAAVAAAWLVERALDVALLPGL